MTLDLAGTYSDLLFERLINRVAEIQDAELRCENLVVGLEPDDRRPCQNLATFDAIWQMRVCQRCRCEYEPPYSGTGE